MDASVIDPACQCAHPVLKRVVRDGEYKAIWKCIDCKREFLTLSADVRPGKIEIMPPMEGMRDRFAMAALTGDWAAQEAESHVFLDNCADSLLEASAKVYYRMADAMLKAREE